MPPCRALHYEPSRSQRGSRELFAKALTLQRYIAPWRSTSAAEKPHLLAKASQFTGALVMRADILSELAHGVVTYVAA